jgi:hypothetical protein
VGRSWTGVDGRDCHLKTPDEEGTHWRMITRSFGLRKKARDLRSFLRKIRILPGVKGEEKQRKPLFYAS